jgi:hypothetical protein
VGQNPLHRSETTSYNSNNNSSREIRRHRLGIGKNMGEVLEFKDREERKRIMRSVVAGVDGAKRRLDSR